MENKTLSYHKIDGWLMVIFIVGLLNAIGDAVLLLQTAVKPLGIFFRGFTRLIPFSNIFVNETLFFVAMPVTLLCTILCLVFIGIRKLFLFKLFFFSACVIGIAHTLCSAVTLYPQTIFDGFDFADSVPFVAGITEEVFGLLKSLYPVVLLTGTLTALGVLFACFVYFKRSKRIAAYFGSAEKN